LELDDLDDDSYQFLHELNSISKKHWRTNPDHFKEVIEYLVDAVIHNNDEWIVSRVPNPQNISVWEMRNVLC
jgi:hypothetical protein